MYSQNDEERVIVDFFGNFQGQFLDIGASDGITLSNTRRLLELGWKGVLVEPAPTNVVKLLENCKQYKDTATVVQTAVTSLLASGLLNRLWMSTHPDRGWSNTIDEYLVTGGHILQPHPVKLLTSCSHIEQFLVFGRFDFITIDAEGEDFFILKGTPDAMLQECRLLSIEPRGNEEREVIKTYLATKNFSVHHETSENILAKNDAS